jgi:putative phosphoesterase
MEPTRIGIISDTHGLLRPEALAALAGVELILHGGDVGHPDVLAGLRAIAPTVAIRGNVDVEPWAQTLPPTELVTHAGVTCYLVHRLTDLDIDPRATGVQVVVYGHSHQPTLEWRGDVLFLNPGSAGPKRFRLPTTVARIDVREAAVVAATFLELGVAESAGHDFRP